MEQRSWADTMCQARMALFLARSNDPSTLIRRGPCDRFSGASCNLPTIGVGIGLGEVCAYTCRQTGVRYRPGITYAGNLFFRAVGVPPDGQFRLVCRHLSSRRSAISYYDSRASTPCPPHPNFRSLHHLRRIHRPPSISSSLSIVLSFLSQPSQAFLCCPHAISFFPHHPWAVTPFSVCSATWLLRCRWQYPR
jgi:hypothetical protein